MRIHGIGIRIHIFDSGSVLSSDSHLGHDGLHFNDAGRSAFREALESAVIDLKQKQQSPFIL